MCGKLALRGLTLDLELALGSRDALGRAPLEGLKLELCRSLLGRQLALRRLTLDLELALGRREALGSTLLEGLELCAAFGKLRPQLAQLLGGLLCLVARRRGTGELCRVILAREVCPQRDELLVTLCDLLLQVCRTLGKGLGTFAAHALLSCPQGVLVRLVEQALALLDLVGELGVTDLLHELGVTRLVDRKDLSAMRALDLMHGHPLSHDTYKDNPFGGQYCPQAWPAVAQRKRLAHIRLPPKQGARR